MIKIKHLKENFGSIRLIATLTPNTFSRKMIVISTLSSIIDGTGETAISHVNSLNNMTIDYKNLAWKIMKTHNSVKEAIDFHIKTINELGYSDCEQLD